MKYIIISILLVISLFASEEIGIKWESNKNCEACHMDISNKWETSRHANSHFSKNDLFKKSLIYIVEKKPTLILDELIIDCAKCHNPRVTKSKISDEDKLSLLIGDNNTAYAYNKSLNSKNMQNGVNCVVCHNIDKIHLDKTVGSRGMHDITFGSQGTMFGPFADSDSPYHKSEQREHFTNNSPKLCFACHFGAKNHQGLEVYSTGKEYDRFSKDNNETVEGCSSCHMSEKKQGFASNYAKVGEKPKSRMVRKHYFASVNNSDIMADYVEVKNSIQDNELVINIKNNTPHKIPTGYGLREITISVSYFDKQDKEVGEERYTLAAKWKDEKGNLTIPYLAKSMASDTRLDGKSNKNYRFSIPKKAAYGKYSLSYRFIGKDMGKILNVTDTFFLKEYIFDKQEVHF